MTVQSAATIWRDHELEGIPASGPHQPIKRDVRLWSQMMEAMNQVNRLGYATLALLNADLAHNANELAVVYADSTPANNGSYQKSGVSGAGSWTRVGDLPGDLVVLTVTGGTGNAITATAIEAPLQPGAKLYLLVPTANNTGATTIVSPISGGSAVAITNALNSPLASGSLIAGNPAILTWQTDHFQLLIAAAVDGNAILAAAVAARDAALAATAAVAISTAADRTALKALDTTLFKSCNLREVGREGAFAWKTGNFAALITADPQEGIYIKANAIASSAGAWVRVRADETMSVLWFGAAGYTAAAAAYALAGTLGAGTVVWPGNTTYDLGNNTLTVPDNIATQASRSAIIRRSADPAAPTTAYSVYSGAMVVLGNYCQWSGGVLDNSTVLTQSSTSNPISAGSKTWTVGTGLPIVVNVTFLRVYSRANPANKIEGAVTAYNSSTGSLTIGAPFLGGSGTWTDWNFNFGSVFHTPMVMHNVTGCLVEDVRVTGYWYIGILMAAWNPPGPSTLLVSKCVVRRCFAESVQNRGFYVYGNSASLLFENCYVNGGNGITDYGMNNNAANASGNANSQQDTRIVNCVTEGTYGQGISGGDAFLYGLIANCNVRSTTGPNGVGILVQANVVGQPSDVTVIGCVVHNCPAQGILFSAALYCAAVSNKMIGCGSGLVIGPSAGVQSQFISVTGCDVRASTTINFHVQGNSNRCTLKDITSLSAGTIGVQIDTGAVATIANGMSINSGTNNLVNNGTSSTTSGLLTT